MEYHEGKIGRTFIIKIEHQDDFLQCLKEVFIKEKVNCAYFYVIGAIKEAKFVSGPENLAIPPAQIWKHMKDKGMELVGIGSIFNMDNEPNIHLHAALGKDSEVNVGCIRTDAHAFIVLEVFVIEILGINIIREFDKTTGLSLLKFL